MGDNLRLDPFRLAPFPPFGPAPARQQRIRDQIRAMTRVDAPYAGMVRYFVKAFGLGI